MPALIFSYANLLTEQEIYIGRSNNKVFVIIYVIVTIMIHNIK